MSLSDSTGDVLAMIWRELGAKPGSMSIDEALARLEARL